MLKLLVFLPCEKIIISRDEGTSVISVLENIVVDVPEDVTTSIDGASLFKWQLLTIWRRDEELIGEKIFEQRVDVISPNGQALFPVITPFKINDQFYNHRLGVEVGIMPTGVAGDLQLKLLLREAGDDNEWQEVTNYPIRITHRRVKVKKQDEENTDGTEIESTIEPQV